jgi:hypothetical protein
MSRVFSAKLNAVLFEYEIGAKKGEFEYRSPSTIEIDDEIERGEMSGEAIKTYARDKLRARLKPAGRAAISVDELVADQEANGNLYEFIGELDKLLFDERAKKKER